MSDERTDGFYAELDRRVTQGRGSCCTGWSFLLLFATLLVLGIVVILVIF